jgi:hypothetical protein
MKPRKVKRTTWILNVKSGTSVSSNCLKPLRKNLSQATGRNAVIRLTGIYSPSFSYYLLTTKNSKSNRLVNTNH